MWQVCELVILYFVSNPVLMILWHMTVCSLVCQYDHFRNLLPSSSKVCSFKMLVPTYHTAQDHNMNWLSHDVYLHKHQSVCVSLCVLL